MEQKEKLEILVACDFSEWRSWKRAKKSGKDPAKVSGFGTAASGLYVTVTNIVDGISGKEAIDKAREIYGILTNYYESCPWERMDSPDPDFEWLFDYREKLQEYGRRLEAFFARCEQEDFICSRKWPEFLQVKEIWEQMKQMNYRRDVLTKYNIDLAEPAPSQK